MEPEIILSIYLIKKISPLVGMAPIKGLILL